MTSSPSSRNRFQSPFPVNSSVGNVLGCLFRSLLIARLHSGLFDHRLLDFTWIFTWNSSVAYPSKDVPSSVPALTYAAAPPPVEVSAHRSCSHCARRMSSIKYDRHTICLQCRDVQCSFDVRCSECSNWSSDMMQYYLKHRKSCFEREEAGFDHTFFFSFDHPGGVVNCLGSLPAVHSLS